tara:strand:- start:1880 stop:2569 length:690 start_codon:yes stop_codon:yes gene_type:complete
MPTADSFTALGRGNGFPFCLNHRTETQLLDRTTFPGGQQERLRLDGSLDEIMKIFWNLYSLRIEASLKIIFDDGSTNTASMDETVLFNEAGEIEDLYFEENGFYPAGVVDFVNKPIDRCAISTNEMAEGFRFDPTGDGNNTFYSFFPEFYYNTTSDNYALIFDFKIEIDKFFDPAGTFGDVYTSNEGEWEGSIPPKTVKIFDTDYQLYSTEGTITIDSITVTDEYFNYS